ncbi:MAG: acyltransferase [Sphingobacteriaceae bacterium]|nr:MAG: acyltransferase [Sphingobacteriaceae bacterium]
METSKKINSLGFLRGFAVIAVCFCHFGYAIAQGQKTEVTHIYKALGDYGKFGVNIFFVISGFIIPLSMDKAKYKLKYIFHFLLKRIVRLHPPYLGGLLITLIIVFLADKVKHIPFPEDVFSIIKSCFYLHIPGDNPVFWTLKIEAEYYIFIAVYFALLTSYKNLTLIISVPLFIFLGKTEIVNYIGLFEFLIFFMIGIVGYLIYNKIGNNWLELMCLFILIVCSFAFYEIPAAIAATATIIFILFYKGVINRYFDFMGEISYSIYLIHYPIGIKMINSTIRYFDPKYYLLLFIATNVVVFSIAYIFWKYLEKPFAQFSNKIKYGTRKGLPQTLPTVS